MRRIFTRVLRRAEVDRAVFFGGLTSVWQLGSASVTMVMIARYLSAETQGFYYTFASLLALQTYVELGLSVVVLNRASHEWAHLRLDEAGRIAGDAAALSRLVSLGRFAVSWYAAASALFVIGAGIGGHLFFSQEQAAVAWRGPWWGLVVLTGLLLWALPLNSLLEGCNQVATVQKFRLSQAVLRTTALWAALALDTGLWALVAATVVSVMRDAYLVGVQYRGFFEPFLSPPHGPRIGWKTEIWPMQWRLAVSGMASYFLFQAFTPVMFQYWGATVAGQMGMTMAVVFVIQGVASVWLQARVPRFGMLIAHRDYAGLDRLWWRTTWAAVGTTALAAAGAWLLVWGLNAFETTLAQRLLPPASAGLLLLGAVFMAAGYCETVYLRAHRQEPIFVLSVVTSVLMGVMVWGLGSQFGPIGAAVAYLIVVAGISLPWETSIWLRCRAEWHGVPGEPRLAPAPGGYVSTRDLTSDSQ